MKVRARVGAAASPARAAPMPLARCHAVRTYGVAAGGRGVALAAAKSPR